MPAIGLLATQYAQQAKAFQRTPGRLEHDLLYRPGGYDSGTAVVGFPWQSTTNYVQCNAIDGARTFSADDLK